MVVVCRQGGLAQLLRADRESRAAQRLQHQGVHRRGVHHVPEQGGTTCLRCLLRARCAVEGAAWGRRIKTVSNTLVLIVCCLSNPTGPHEAGRGLRSRSEDGERSRSPSSPSGARSLDVGAERLSRAAASVQPRLPSALRTYSDSTNWF